MAHLTISLLGPLQIFSDDNPVTAFESDKVRALLIYLAVESHQPHRRETLAGLLWPEQPERSARHNLSQALFNLRCVISDCNSSSTYLLTTRQSLQFNTDSDHTLDVAVFTTLLSTCEKHQHEQMETCKPCIGRLQEAIGLYRGPFLDQFYFEDSSAIEEWVLVKRERLQRYVLGAFPHVVAYYEQRGEFQTAYEFARRQVKLEPWDEIAQRTLMRTLVLNGQRNAALRQYQACRRMLVDELGVEPVKETTELFKQIRDGKFEHPKPSSQNKVTQNESKLRPPPFSLLARVMMITLLFVLSVGLVAGFLKLTTNPSVSYLPNGHPDIPLVEYQALVTFYTETGGSNWKNSDGWLTDTTPCNWFGVTCDRGSVTQLTLPDNNLSGSIPPEFGNLRKLDLVDLYHNLFDGSIPPELGNLTNLTSLDLSYNTLLSGSIPPEMGNLSNLNHLTVCGNSQLSGPIPPELGNLARLESLCLSTYDGATQLNGPIPPELGNLRRLLWIELSNSLVSGPIPPELGNLTNLTSLDLSYNQLSGPIPSELGNLTNLKYLSVCGNNQLSGEIPPELGNLFQLESLYLSKDTGGTQLSGKIPPELGNLRRLEYLDISNTLINGPIPSELGNLTNLKYLSLVQNLFSGPIPPELGNLTELQTLSVGEGVSDLEGSLPLSLTNLKKIEYFTYGTHTNLCEPADAAFQKWLNNIPVLDGPRVVCPNQE